MRTQIYTYLAACLLFVFQNAMQMHAQDYAGYANEVRKNV